MPLRAILILLAAAVLAACANRGAPALEGRIWDVGAQRFIPERELFERLARARHVILGETHDNPEHHRLQLEVLKALGPERRVLAMEQFDSEHQAAMDGVRSRDTEALADAGRFDRKGWNWPLYRPLVELALERGWPVRAANLSRAEARRIVGDPGLSGLSPADATVLRALEDDIADGHCGQRPEAKRLAGMVEAQRARDARMASVLTEPSVLIAGSGHARRDRGVPLYMRDRDVVSVGLMETQPGKTAPRGYPGEFDYVWFTRAHGRPDPCR